MDAEEIVFILEGRRIPVACQSGETVMDAARRAGVNIPFGCEQGECGTCIVELVQGEVEMRKNSVLEAPEIDAGCVLACQAVPISAKCQIEIY